MFLSFVFFACIDAHCLLFFVFKVFCTESPEGLSVRGWHTGACTHTDRLHLARPWRRMLRSMAHSQTPRASFLTSPALVMRSTQQVLTTHSISLDDEIADRKSYRLSSALGKSFLLLVATAVYLEFEALHRVKTFCHLAAATSYRMPGTGRAARTVMHEKKAVSSPMHSILL